MSVEHLRLHQLPFSGYWCCKFQYDFLSDIDKQTNDLRYWCYETYGNAGHSLEHSCWVDGVQFGEVLFRTKADAMFFMLKWS